MQKRTKFSIIFIITFLILIVVVFMYANRKTRDFRKLLNSQGSVDYATVKDVVITETKDAVKEWEVYSAVAEYDNKKVTATMHDIVGNYYKKGEVVMSFTAPKGSYNSESKKIELFEGVKVVGKDNVELTADSISWVMTEDKIYAEGNVIINKNNEIIALSNQAAITKDFKQMEISENAELRVYKEFKNKNDKLKMGVAQKTVTTADAQNSTNLKKGQK